MERRKIVAVDFDGTLCVNEFPNIGEGIPQVIKKVLEYKAEGYILILWTCRVDEQLTDAIYWCRSRGIEFDYINENAKETIEAFGSESRKIFADEYLDDRAVNINDIIQVENDDDFAAREVALYYSGGCDGYDGMCAKSALKAYRSLQADGHSVFSISVTKSILDRLIDGKPLSPLADIDDQWRFSYTRDCDGANIYQNTRYSSLFKYIYEDGSVKYTDVNAVVKMDIDTGITWSSGIVSDVYFEMHPIVFPYYPAKTSATMYCEDFLFNEDNDDYDDYDTVGMFYLVLPDKTRVDINRYFKEGEDGKTVEIDLAEYAIRKANKIK